MATNPLCPPKAGRRPPRQGTRDQTGVNVDTSEEGISFTDARDGAVPGPQSVMASWFAGPKSENAEWFEGVLQRIALDYYSWRRNYFPADGFVFDSHARREGEPFRDAFEDRLAELLGRLKANFPFHSPRYAAHMIAEQTLPSIAGNFAAMLYNPNNVSREAAPVTVRLETEACRMLCEMIGFESHSWGHLTSGGTVANIEALWIARTVAFLPKVVAQMRSELGLAAELPPGLPVLEQFARVFDDADKAGVPLQTVLGAYHASDYCVVERGMAAVVASSGTRPVVLVPESHHYCFDKACDILGIGRSNLVRVPVDTAFRMDVTALAEILERTERDDGLVVAVVAVVGTTEEGAVDPVDKILDLRARRVESGSPGFWLHVDGAYGAYLRTMTRPTRIGLGEPTSNVVINGREVSVPLDLPVGNVCDALQRMGEVDSITIDPHKLGYIPYPAGAVCFRSDLVKPLSRQYAPYIGDAVEDPETERNSEGIGLYILEGSKPGAAAASVWLSHSLIPLDTTGHGALVRETVRNACELHAILEHWTEWHPGSEVKAVTLAAPASNIVCFAFRPNGETSLKEINRLNQSVYERFTMPEDSRVYSQEFFVSKTTIQSDRYGESAVGNFLGRLGVSLEGYRKEHVVLLRSVLMNPWYSKAKEKGRYYLAEFAEALFDEAHCILNHGA